MNKVASFFVDKGVFESSSPARGFIIRADDLGAISEIDYEFAIIKYDLGICKVGNFTYPNYFQYDFVSKQGKAHRVKHEDVECLEFSIRQRMSDYADDVGTTPIKFKVGNAVQEVFIDGGCCETPKFVGAIIDFMKELAQDYSANWAYYNKVKDLKTINEELVQQVAAHEKTIAYLKSKG
jgi:hypothetical protein